MRLGATSATGRMLQSLDDQDSVVPGGNIKARDGGDAQEEPGGVFVEIPELHGGDQEKSGADVEFERTVDATDCDAHGGQPEQCRRQ